MLKKFTITALFSLLLIFTGFTGGGFAQTTENDVSPEIAAAKAEVEKVNAEIYAEIAKVQLKAEKMYADYLAEFNSTTDVQKQTAAFQKYDVKVEEEIAKLQEKTEAMTAKGLENATAAGLSIEVVWVKVEFADRIREIDPLKVIGW